MKHVLNFFGSILCLIIGFIVAVLLFAYTTMNSTEFLVKENMVKNLIVDIDVKDLVGEESYQEINDLLEDSGIPSEYVDYIVENEEIKEYLGEYASSAVDYILYEKEMPAIDEDELTELLINSFDSIVELINNNEIDIDITVTESEIAQVHETISKYVPQIVEEIPDLTEFVEETLLASEDYQETKETLNKITDGIELVKKGYSQKYILLIIIIVGLALIVLIKFRSPKLANWLWRPFITACILCATVAIECKSLINYFYPEQLSFLRTFVDNNINHISSIYKRDAIIYLVIIILLIVFKIVMTIRRNKKENKAFDIDVDHEDKLSSKKEEAKEEVKEIEPKDTTEETSEVLESKNIDSKEELDK